MSEDLALHEIFRAKVGKGGINIVILCIFTACDANIIVTDVNAVSQTILKYNNSVYIITAGDESMVVTDIDAVSKIILKGLSIFRFVGGVLLKAMHA